jgi:hypothetical protein
MGVSGFRRMFRTPYADPIQSITILGSRIAAGGTLPYAGSTKWRQAMGKKDEYCATMESEIKKWDAEVDSLNAKGNQMSVDVRASYDTQLKAMRADRDLAYSKLQELRIANESAWQHMQSGVDAAWTSMKNALDKAASQFK